MRRTAWVTVGLGLVASGLGPAFPSRGLAQPPGPEIFGDAPTTPLQLWDAADYLVRTGQARAAVPYLKKFVAAAPDDATLLQVRDRYGVGSVLRLQDDPATREFAAPVAEKMAAAGHTVSTRPERLAGFIDALTRSKEEQEYGLEGLRKAGPYAVPPLIAAMEKEGLSADRRTLLARNLGRLDASAVPPLVAALDAPNGSTAADAADALGRIGDARAVAPLTIKATGKGPAAESARRAVERLTNRPFASQPKAPALLFIDEARGYHTHRIKFPGDSVVVWTWDAAANAPAAKAVSRTDAEADFARRYADAAVALAPTDLRARATAQAVALETAVERTGFDTYPAGDATGTFDKAVAAGPAVLGAVLRTAVADGKSDLAAVAALALGRATSPQALAAEGTSHPLVEALSAPGRRTRFAAARALVTLDPKRPFAGSSRVVPALAPFLGSHPTPRAVVIDSNLTRGLTQASFLKTLGYDPVAVPTGAEGFEEAAESADVELVLVSYNLILGEWRLLDVLANLRADARTAGLPVYVVSPLHRQVDLASLAERFPGVKFLVTPTTARSLDEQLAIAGRPTPMPAAERAKYEAEAAALLARIASRPDSPFASDLAAVEPALSVALNAERTSPAASAALAEIPSTDAQRSLADLLVDPSRPAPQRVTAAGRLTRSVQRFGPLIAPGQQVRLQSAFDHAEDPALKNALGAALSSLRPKVSPIPAPVEPGAPNPLPASPSPEAAPSNPQAGTPNANAPG